LETTRQLAVVFSFYTAPRYVFKTRKLLEMAAEFDDPDRSRFDVDTLGFDWPTYTARVHLPGLERFALKDRDVAVVEESAFEESVEASITWTNL
jgi:alcohol-forming fatty acyl-CoA reductase